MRNPEDLGPTPGDADDDSDLDDDTVDDDDDDDGDEEPADGESDAMRAAQSNRLLRDAGYPSAPAP